MPRAIEVPTEIVQKWQEIVDLLAEIMQVPSALVMRVDPPTIKVFVSSHSTGNPYERDEVACLETGLYCETVMRTRQPLLVPDALVDDDWKSNPDIKLGMISYLGFPLLWPDGEIFGTICVLDNKPNEYGVLHRKLLGEFRDVVQADLGSLAALHEQVTRRAEEERRYHTHLLRTLTDNASSMLYMVDAAGRATYVNPALERITGYRAEELIGHVVHYKIHHTKPDGKPYPAGECALAGAVRTGHTIRGEDVFVRKDGTFFPVQYTVSPILRDGAPVGTVIEAQDLTERKAAEEELRKQAALLSLAHDAIIVRDAQSRILFWNRGAERTYGWTAGEAIGRISHELLQTRFPVSRHAVDVALQEKGEWEGELTHVTREGKSVVVTSRQSLRGDEQEAGATILEINRDVTARRRAEYFTRVVVDATPDAVAVVGRDYRYRRLNPIFARNWQMPPERIVGMHVADVVGRELYEQTAKPNLDRCFAGEQLSFEDWFTIAVGRRYLSVRYTPLRLDSERVEAVLVITRDLTDHMLAVEALQKAYAELAHVARVTTLGELAASIAHEINQPLAAIVADANAALNWLVGQRPDLERVRDALEAIVTDGHRAADVMQRIRQLATKSAAQKARLDINGVIRDIVPLVRAEVLAHEVSLRIELAPQLPAVLADRVQLQQVILNLAVNGIEAMASVGDRRRELTIRSARYDGDHVMVAVQDTGAGIDPNTVDTLLSAFFTTKPGGMGMGLSISRSIIEAHGGRLWATANEPHGAIFYLSLPVDASGPD